MSTNTIAVFKNDKRKTEEQPLYRVSVEIDGVKWEGGLWKKTAKSGLEYLGGTLKPPFDGAAEQRRPSRPQPKGRSANFDDMDDDIPLESNKQKAVDW